jgi:hypothetical protein
MWVQSRALAGHNNVQIRERFRGAVVQQELGTTMSTIISDRTLNML